MEEWKGLWDSPEDIQSWIDGHFFYDDHRQAQQENPETRTDPMRPEDFFNSQTPDGHNLGACMDLTKFGVTALNAVDPDANAQMMQINMSKTNDDGTTKDWRHWIGVYVNDQGNYVGFADSRNPSQMYDNGGAGYDTPQALFDAYQAYWNSKANRRGDIVDWPGSLKP